MITINLGVWVFVITSYGKVMQGPGKHTPGFIQDWYRGNLPWHNALTGDTTSRVKDKFTKEQIRRMRSGCSRIPHRNRK